MTLKHRHALLKLLARGGLDAVVGYELEQVGSRHNADGAISLNGHQRGISPQQRLDYRFNAIVQVHEIQRRIHHLAH